MSDITMETRIGILEHQVKSLMEIQTQVRETHEKVFELGVLLDAQAKLPECPAPGKCLLLDERLTVMEMKAAEAKGGWKVAAGVSALVTGLLAWIWNHFTSTKHP